MLVSVLHVASPHCLPAPDLRHAPLPSQVPSLPHGLVAVSSVHAWWAVLPFATGAHVPSAWPVSALEQALQPLQVVAQQMPSTQLVLEHCPSVVQEEPLAKPGPASVPMGTSGGEVVPPAPLEPPLDEPPEAFGASDADPPAPPGGPPGAPPAPAAPPAPVVIASFVSRPSAPSPTPPPLPSIPGDADKSAMLPSADAGPGTQTPWVAPWFIEQWKLMGQLDGATHGIFDVFGARKQAGPLRQSRRAAQRVARRQPICLTTLVFIGTLRSTTRPPGQGQAQAREQRWSTSFRRS